MPSAAAVRAKSEIRSTKSETNPNKPKEANPKRNAMRFRSLGLIRISDLIPPGSPPGAVKEGDSFPRPGNLPGCGRSGSKGESIPLRAAVVATVCLDR